MSKKIQHKGEHTDHPAVSIALPGISNALRTKNFAQAINSATKLLESAPKDARLHDLLSTALALNLNRELAAHHAQIALKLNPNDPALARRAISVLQRAGHYDQALAHTERVLYQNPKDEILAKLKINLLTDLGKDRQAAKSLDQLAKTIDQSKPQEALAHALLSARLAPHHIKAHTVIPTLQSLLDAQHPNLPAPMVRAAHFELARLLEKESDYDNAFNHYKQGNALNDLPWNPDSHSALVTKLINNKEALDKVPQSTYSHPTLSGKNIVFILGMMRSGSSLLEQILAQLPNLIPALELPTILQAVTKLENELNPDQPLQTFPLPVSADRYTQDHINNIAKLALDRYAQVLTDAGFAFTSSPLIITDKQTEHYHLLPLLPKILPGCTIIHTSRDPLDTCLSNFTQSFAQGHPQTATLNSIAQFHNDHDRLMNTWNQMDNLTIHDVNYADLVNNPEQETKKLASLLNLDWTPKVLDFHKSKRTVATASQQQVRQPLYTTSVGRAARFNTTTKDHLAPLREALAQNIDP